MAPFHLRAGRRGTRFLEGLAWLVSDVQVPLTMRLPRSCESGRAGPSHHTGGAVKSDRTLTASTLGEYGFRARLLITPQRLLLPCPIRITRQPATSYHAGFDGEQSIADIH